MKIIQLLLLVTVLLNLPNTIQAQTVINAASHIKESQGIIHQYSIGEMVLVQTARTQKGSLTQGFIQPAISIKANNDQNNGLNPDNWVRVYPNPSSRFVSIEFFEEQLAAIELFDATGKIVRQQKQQNIKQTLDLQGLANANYFLKITLNNKQSFHYTLLKQN